MKKKIFAIALALCMVLTMMPSMGFAEEENAQQLTCYMVEPQMEMGNAQQAYGKMPYILKSENLVPLNILAL